jgi:hypothetical protein
MIGLRREVLFQMDFRKVRRTVDSIFIIKSVINKYLSKERDKVYMLFIDFQREFDKVVIVAFWWKLGRIGLSSKFIEGYSDMYRNVKLGVQICEKHSRVFDRDTGLRQGCSLSSHLIIDKVLLAKLNEASTLTNSGNKTGPWLAFCG